MRCRYAPGVLDEVAEAIEYLEGERPGLGQHFYRSLESTLLFIEAFPNAAPAVYLNARRVVVRDFPYNVIYEPRGDLLLIIAVLHGARDPEKWRSRVR